MGSHREEDDSPGGHVMWHGGLEDARPDQDWLNIVSILVPGISFSSVMDK